MSGSNTGQQSETVRLEYWPTVRNCAARILAKTQKMSGSNTGYQSKNVRLKYWPTVRKCPVSLLATAVWKCPVWKVATESVQFETRPNTRDHTSSAPRGVPQFLQLNSATGYRSGQRHLLSVTAEKHDKQLPENPTSHSNKTFKN